MIMFKRTVEMVTTEQLKEAFEDVFANRIYSGYMNPSRFYEGDEALQEMKKNGIYSFEEGRVQNGVAFHSSHTGGYEGGSCWGGEPRRYSTERKDEDFPPLTAFLEAYIPEITFLQFRRINSLLLTGNRIEREYYGNTREYKVEALLLDDLRDFLNEKNLVLSEPPTPKEEERLGW